MIGKRYWATGVTVGAFQDADGKVRWGATVDYFDDGFADDSADAGEIATQGSLRTRYFVRPGERVDALTAVIDAIIRDAERLGIEWRPARGIAPALYGDGEEDAWLPDGWGELLAAQAERLGWVDDA